MTKLAYERPIMRAEAFATNAYCTGCVREPAGSKSFLRYLLQGVGVLFFNTDQNKNTNMNTGADQFYYTESQEFDFTDEDYFLEYSAQNNNYNLYKDLSDSGYGAKNTISILGSVIPLNKETQVSGVGSLQTAGFLGRDDGWCTSSHNPAGTTNNWYRPDKVIATGITFDSVTQTEYVMSF